MQRDEYTYHTDIRDKDALRGGFISLAKAVFGLDFTRWYEGGWWTDRYQPHVLTHEGRVVANVSANIMDIGWRGEMKRLIQIGTVMTDPAYRGRGLGRRLMETVLRGWEGRCEGIYLLANDSVLGFYPAFGFTPAPEYAYACPIQAQPSQDICRLNMDREEDRSLLLARYRLSNPYSAVTMERNEGLLMFYCGQFLRECVYYLPELEAVAVASQEGDTLLCYDAFCDGRAGLAQVLAALAAPQTTRAALGFTPRTDIGFTVRERREEDETLFVKGGMTAWVKRDRVMLPLLSHA